MSLRISSLLIGTLLLAACGMESLKPGGITMDCAVNGAGILEPVCSVYEVKAVDEIAYLVMWHPDGGFRRIRYRNAEKSIETLDGAAPASGVTHLEDGSVAFAIDSDRYRLPAQMVRLNEAIQTGER